MSAATRSTNVFDSVRPSAWEATRSRESNATPRRFARISNTEALSAGDEAVERLKSIQTTWSDQERAARRRQALRKQEELLLLLAGNDLECVMRGAVANGEQPVMLPELVALQAS